MDLQHLRTFRVVAENESIRQAAHIMGYSPASISHQMTQFQKDTGLLLFEKSGRGLKVTHNGQLLLARTEDFFREYSSLETYIAGLREEKDSVFSCYYITSFGATVIPNVLQQISQEYPHTRFDLHLNDEPQIFTSPMPDLQIVVEEQSFNTPAGFSRHRILKEPYCVAIPCNHHLAQESKPLNLAQIRDELWIDVEPTKGWCWKNLVNSCEAVGYFPNFHIQAYDYPMALQIVASGLGICVLPRIGTYMPVEGVVVRGLDESGPQRMISALVPHAVAGNGNIAHRVVELLREATAYDHARA